MKSDTQPPIEVLRRHGKTFAFAGLFLPQQILADSSTLYAFCRHLDDLVDGQVDTPTVLAELRETEAALAGITLGPERLQAFINMAERTGLNLDSARQLVAGMEADLSPVGIEDRRQMLRYCYQVAGTVGEMMCAVLDIEDRRAHPHAVDLGIGMQLINIARDVHEDALAGRRYLPADLCPLSPTEIASWKPSEQPFIADARRKLIELAEVFFENGERGFKYIEPRSRFAIAVAARAYRQIGRKLLKDDRLSCPNRVFVGALEKARLALSSGWDLLINHGLARNRKTRSTPIAWHGGAA